jgi:hypothetical protein
MARQSKPKPAHKSALAIRDRVIEQRKVTAAELAANPKNFRKHPEKQVRALRGVLAEIGFAGAALAYYSESAGGALTLIDGHLRRQDLGPEFAMACTIVDLSDAEADKLLACFDPLGAMAKMDGEKLDALLRDVQTGDEDLAAVFGDMAEKAGLLATDPEDVSADGQTQPTEHSCVLRYDDADVKSLKRFLNVQELPDRLGTLLMERIRETARGSARGRKRAAE